MCQSMVDIQHAENYQVCSVQYCVQQLCTVPCSLIWTDLTVLWIGFCLTGPISLCLDSFLYCVLLCIVCMRRFVTRWGGPGGIEACPQDHYFLRCFDTVGWVIWPVKTIPEMTYNVFSGTLNPTHSLQPAAAEIRRGKKDRNYRAKIQWPPYYIGRP